MTVSHCSAWIAGLLLSWLSLANAAAGSTTEIAPDTMQARVMGCAACHGAQGQGTDNDYFPRLAGKPAGYLFNQLLAFRDGRRNYPPMNYLLAYLPDAYLERIADYFAAQRPPYPTPTKAANESTFALGKSLVNDGNAQRKIPACASCHGPGLTGMEPSIPGLLGLHADYISAQLGAWRYGTRKTIAPDCMHDIASHLGEQDITAIAAYLASLPAQSDPAPAAVGSLTMPLTCGTEKNK